MCVSVDVCAIEIYACDLVLLQGPFLCVYVCEYVFVWTCMFVSVDVCAREIYACDLVLLQGPFLCVYVCESIYLFRHACL